MKIKLNEFKRDVLKQLEDDLFNVSILDNKEKVVKQYSYCNTERIFMFIADYAKVEQVDDELFIDAIIYKEFIRVKTRDHGFISVDLSMKE